jgi:hypothetical protein
MNGANVNIFNDEGLTPAAYLHFKNVKVLNLTEAYASKSNLTS